MDLLDTARLYGDSEAVIGRCAAEAGLRIVTKTAKFAGRAPDEAAAQLRTDFADSLARLERPRVYGLLLHDPADLSGAAGEAVWAAMAALKEEGRVERIGVSVYEGSEIDRLLDRFPLDLVQLPWNPLDHRLEQGGQLARLAQAGVEVHARSLFLQGLLLQAPDEIAPRFGPVRGAVESLRAAAEAEGLTVLEGVLALAFGRREIDRFVCGVAAAGELRGIVEAAEKGRAAADRFRLPAMQPLDAVYLNPACWSELG
jgi:aryl-alcohol dehydrogenase-like predicted oxidoreductase